MSDICAFEYATVRVPYEALNKQFRVAQKTLEREVSHTEATLKDLDRELRAPDSAGKVESVRGKVLALKERLSLLDKKCSANIHRETHDATLVKNRVEYLVNGERESSAFGRASQFEQHRVDGLIVDYLLRAGYYETAQLLAQDKGVSETANFEIFSQAHEVLSSLRIRETNVVLQWCHENKSKLRRVSSPLELLVRQQDFIELVRLDRRQEAVAYARKHFPAVTHKLWQSSQLSHVLGVLTVSDMGAVPEHYVEVMEEARWSRLEEVFWDDFHNIFQLPKQSAFSACLQSGICALKTPHCKPRHDGSSTEARACPVCHVTMFALAETLPYAHASQSKLVDMVTGERMDDENPPMALPNGSVYGSRTLRRLAEENDGEIICPRTKQAYRPDQAMRVFVM